MNYKKTFTINDDIYTIDYPCTNQEFIQYFINTIINKLKEGIIIKELHLGDKPVDKKLWQSIDTFYALGYSFNKDEAYDIIYNPNSPHAIFVNSQIEVIQDLLKKDASSKINEVISDVCIKIQRNLDNPNFKDILLDIYQISDKLQIK